MISSSISTVEHRSDSEMNLERESIPLRHRTDPIIAKVLAWLTLVSPLAGFASCSRTSSSLPGLDSEELSSFQNITRSYHEIDGNGNVSSDLVLAGMVADMDVSELNSILLVLRCISIVSTQIFSLGSNI